jgi:uncharacterized protein (UPF0335 family)
MDETIGARIRAFIERIERLEEEKKALSEDVKEVYFEAKGQGLEVKILRKIVALRKMDPNAREEEEALLDSYMSAMGMVGTPLGDYASRDAA